MSESQVKEQLQRGPSFLKPPVVETALGIQFDELDAFTTQHFALFFDCIKDEFPRYEDQPRLGRIQEFFPLRPALPSLRFGQMPQRPERVWYLDQDQVCLLQLQPDRFGFNWRRRDEEEYPRFAEYAPRFLDGYARLCDFCEKQGLGSIRPDICEVVYVNQILPKDGESIVECFTTVFSGADLQSSTGFLGSPESLNLNRTYRIEGDRGRLYAEAGANSDISDHIQLKMTARVRVPLGESPDKSLITAHDWVVQGFEAVTTSDARRKRWEQCDE